jgi:hypothetical protein
MHQKMDGVLKVAIITSPALVPVLFPNRWRYRKVTFLTASKRKNRAITETPGIRKSLTLPIISAIVISSF